MKFDLLKAGDEVGILAPASPVTPEQLAPAIAWLESAGYRVRVGTSVGAADRFLAGEDTLRSDDLVGMYADDSIKGIFAARGGYGSSRLLNLVDWDTIASHPKPFVGLSDTTAFQVGLYVRTGLGSYSGLALRYDAPDGPPDTGLQRDLELALRSGRCEAVSGLDHNGSLSGRLIGGCLSLVTHLLGTPFFPDLTGHVLLLEDVGESPYRVDRMLTQLLLSGVLNAASGCAFGTFYNCVGSEEDGSIDEVLADFIDRCPCPVVRGIPYGHGPDRRILPIGARVKVEEGVMTFEEMWG